MREPPMPARVGAVNSSWNFMNDLPEHLTKTEARAGPTPHMTRYVLGIGLILIVVVFAAMLLVAG